MIGEEGDVKMKEKEQWQTDNEIEKKVKKETKKEEKDYVHLRRDGTSGGSERMAFGTIFTFLGDHNSSEVRSRDRFVRH